MSDMIPVGWSDLLREIKPFGDTDLDAVLTRARSVLGLDGIRITAGKRRLASSGSIPSTGTWSSELPHSRNTLIAMLPVDFGHEHALEAFASVLDLAMSSADRRAQRLQAPLMEPMGTRDRLTDTIDRDGFSDYLDMELAAAPDSVALLMLSIDALDAVNETLGHAAGDLVIAEAANRIRETVRSGDVLSRVRVDTFAIYCPSVDVHIATALVGRLQDAIGMPIEVGGRTIRATTSAGVAMRGRAERSADMLEHADVALQAARSSDGASQVAIYDGVVRTRSEDRRALANELVDALADNQLSTSFEPIVHLPEGTVVGVEAHVLWNHPTRGQIDRVDFMDLAELIGRADDVERAVLDFAIEQNSRRDRKVRTGVNISSSTLHDTAAVAWIAERLQSGDHKVIIEVDESSISSQHAVRHLTALRDAGASIVLDDFGLGNASLRALHSFAFDGVKLHSSLLREGSNSRASAIIKAVGTSSRSMGFDVIHAGVDSDGDLRRLMELCGSADGEGFYAQGKAVRERVTQKAAAA